MRPASPTPCSNLGCTTYVEMRAMKIGFRVLETAIWTWDFSNQTWDFSLETYRRPGVQEACLKLQDDLGADVNMLLYCCWRGGFADGEMRDLLADLAPWQNGVVHGLRSVRRALKQMVAELGALSKAASGLRNKIAALELEAEKLQHTMLSRHSI